MGIRNKGQRAGSCQLPSAPVPHLHQSSDMAGNAAQPHEDGTKKAWCQMAHQTTRSDLQHSHCVSVASQACAQADLGNSW